jgi:hypothetical protein
MDLQINTKMSHDKFFRESTLNQRYSPFFVCVPSDIFSLQRCTPEVFVHNSSYT